jgi:hypothetical protein
MSKMPNPLEFCPRCQAVESAVRTLGLRSSIDRNGAESENFLFYLHCRACNAYIRSYPMGAESRESDTIELSEYVVFGDKQGIPV